MKRPETPEVRNGYTEKLDIHAGNGGGDYSHCDTQTSPLICLPTTLGHPTSWLNAMPQGEEDLHLKGGHGDQTVG